MLALPTLDTLRVSSSKIVPVPVWPPIVSVTVSSLSSIVSPTVGIVTVNVLMFAGTVMKPPTSVTPLLKATLAAL